MRQSPLHTLLKSSPLIGATLFMLPAPASALDAIVAIGENCPSGSTAVTFAEAQANKDELCRTISRGAGGSAGTWFIARLAGGGSMDGPGYQCRMRPQDARSLGHALCKTAAVVPPTGNITITGCAEPGVESACVIMKADGATYNISGAGPRPPAWGHWITVTGKRRTGGASSCEGTPLTDMTWSYVQRPQACPPRPPSLWDPGPAYP